MDIFRYKVPFKKPFATAHGQMLFREGLLVRLEWQNLEGWGEIAPLPDFGEGGDVANALILLRNIAPRLNKVTPEEILGGWLEKKLTTAVTELQAQPNLNITGQIVSVVRFGLELAAWDLLGKATNKSLAELWGATPSPIPVNGTIGLPDIGTAMEAAENLGNAGFRCIKLKVGVCQNETTELARVIGVRQALGNVETSGEKMRLRLDANEAWTVPQAIRLLKQMAFCDIELVEQPIPADDLTGLAQVQREVDVPIAADEAVTSLAAAQKIIDAKAAQVLVIKPSLVGGIEASRQIIELAKVSGLQAIVTTSLDTGVGIAAALQLAQLLTRPTLACGLATAGLLENTLVTNPPLVQNGLMYPLDKPGLGVEIDQQQLEKYASGPFD